MIAELPDSAPAIRPPGADRQPKPSPGSEPWPDTPPPSPPKPPVSRLSRLEVEGVIPRVVAGIALAAIAVLLRLLLSPILGDTVPFLLYFPVIVVASLLGGRWTGMLTVAACSVAQTLLFEQPVGSPVLADAGAALRMGLFVVNGVAISLLTGAAFDARRAAARSRGVAEERYASEVRAREEIERASRRTRVLYETAAALSDAVTPEDVADTIIRQGVLALGAHIGVVRQVAPDGTSLMVLRGRGFTAGSAHHFETLTADATTPSAHVLRTGVASFWHSRAELVRDFPATAAAATENQIEAVTAVPLGPEDRPIGTLLLAFPEPQPFTDDAREFILALGHECSQALERARLYRAEQEARQVAEAGSIAEQRARGELEESRRALEMLADISELLSSTLEYESTLQQVADRLVPEMADWLAVDLVHPDGSVRTVALAHADPTRLPLLREYRERYPPRQHRGGSIESIDTGQSVLVADVAEERIAAAVPDPDIAELARRLEIRSYLSVPLRGSQAVLGALALASSTSGRYRPRDLALLEDVARRVTAALEHAQVYREARQFIATVDATLDAVFMFEPATLRFTYVNQGALAQVGYERSDLLSMRAIDIKPDFDETRYRQLLAPLMDGSRPSITFSTVHRHRTGFDIPVEVFLQHVRLPGGQARMIITSRDIRAQIDVQASLYRLARAERVRAAELNAVIQGMSEGVLVCDADGRVVLANQAATAVLGTPVDGYRELVGRLEPTDDPLPALGMSSPPVEARVRGEERWLEVTSAHVATDPGGSATGDSTILVLRDVTASRQAQAAREAFIGVLSHELRTPITTIYGNTKLIRRVRDPERQQEMLGDIELEADRLYRLVEDLLILSRAETGLRIEGEPILLQHLIPAVLESERPRWPDTTFRATLPSRLSAVVADRTYLEQVIRNLVTNAAKYGPTPGEVTVTADVADHGIAIRVSDDGEGVPRGEEERVFQLFYRSPATARKAAGAGIGLYVCRVLVEAMGGRIWAQPRGSEPAQFGFTVPMLAGDPASDDIDETGGSAVDLAGVQIGLEGT